MKQATIGRKKTLNEHLAADNSSACIKNLKLKIRMSWENEKVFSAHELNCD